MSDEDYREPRLDIPELDVATGLPLVPEGYFWRVLSEQEDYRYNATIWVQLRKRSPVWWQKNHTVRVASRSAYAEDPSQKIWIRGYYHYAAATPEQVKELTLKLAALVYRDEKNTLESIERSRAQKAALKQIVGDYPPKAL